MRTISLLSFLVCSLLTGCMKSCSNDGSSAGGAAKAEDKRVNLFIWGEYTSQELFKEFEEKTGIKVVESNFSTNEEMLAKLQAGAEGYDLIVPSDYMIAVMRQLNLLAPLDRNALPNLKNVSPDLLGRAYDPKNEISVPYSWAVTGIVFNKSKLTKPVTGYRDLFSRNDLNQRVSILDDNREAMASILKSQGHSANTTDDVELQEAKSKLLAVKKMLREFNSSPSAMLQQGDLLAAQIYSNEALRLAAKKPEFEFILPDDGFTMAIDNMAIPQSSKRKNQAHALINFLLDESVNIRFAKELLAAPVVKGATEKLPESMRSNPAIGQFELIKLKSEMIKDLGQNIEKYDRIWTEVKASSI